MTRWLTPEEVWELYSQETHWRDRTGRKHMLYQMDDRYLENVRQFIERHGAAHCWTALWTMAPPRMNGTEAQRIAEQAVDEMTEDLMVWAHSIEDSPLYKAVCLEFAGRSKVGA